VRDTEIDAVSDLHLPLNWRLKLNRWLRFSAGLVCTGLLLMLVFSGCSDDPVDIERDGGVVYTDKIISNPLAPAPGETTVLTVQASGESSELPVYT
jgi:hypothetical protein